MKELFETIAQIAPEVKKVWVQMAQMETPSADKAGVDRLVEFLCSVAADAGFRTAVHPFPNAGNGLVITYETGADVQPVTLMAHMDTVHKKGAFGQTAVTEENGFLMGPGVYDCKGGIAVALLTMKALKATGYRKRSIKLVLSPDEEVCAIYSGEPGKNYLRNNVRGSVMAINCESGSPLGTPSKTL